MIPLGKAYYVSIFFLHNIMKHNKSGLYLQTFKELFLHIYSHKQSLLIFYSNTLYNLIREYIMFLA